MAREQIRFTDKLVPGAITGAAWAIWLARTVFGGSLSRTNEDFLFAAIALALVYAIDRWVSLGSRWGYWGSIIALLVSFPPATVATFSGLTFSPRQFFSASAPWVNTSDGASGRI